MICNRLQRVVFDHHIIYINVIIFVYLSSAPQSGVSGVLYYLSQASDYDKISELEVFSNIEIIIVIEAKDFTR